MDMNILRCDECCKEKGPLLEIEFGGNYGTLCPECTKRLRLELDRLLNRLDLNEQQKKNLQEI